VAEARHHLGVGFKLETLKVKEFIGAGQRRQTQTQTQPQRLALK
jgi:hypothetical protein